MPQSTGSLTVFVYPDAGAASRAAGDRLAAWLTVPGARSLVAAAGNSPLRQASYRRVAERRVRLPDLHVFALDEYVAVPPHDTRTCANLLRRAVADAWGIPAERYHALSGRPHEVAASIREYEEEARPARRTRSDRARPWVQWASRLQRTGEHAGFGRPRRGPGADLRGGQRPLVQRRLRTIAGGYARLEGHPERAARLARCLRPE